MKDLLVMLSGFNNESTDSSFEKIAKTLFGDYHIQKDTKTYELMEIEFYLYSESHKDIITYPRENDKAGMWFFHMSGVDITFNVGFDGNTITTMDFAYDMDLSNFSDEQIALLEKQDFCATVKSAMSTYKDAFTNCEKNIKNYS